MTERLDDKALAEITAQVVAAYVSHNAIAVSDLPGVISTVGERLKALGSENGVTPKAKPEPAVSARRSVTKSHLTCLLCGKEQKMLKRHLMTAHKLTPADYREMFGLKSDYPMIAPNYAKARSELARKIGLGRRTKTRTRKKATIRKRAA